MKDLNLISLVVNRHKPGADALAESVAQIIKTHGVDVRITDKYPVPTDSLREVDACVVIGGDGTLLSALEESLAHDVPLMGVNHGKLGFLATFSPADIQEQLPKILNGEYVIEERTLLEAKVGKGDTYTALNDVVIKNGQDSRLITLRVTCDNSVVTRYDCDGLIFATPTGSTAYNLSANGPIIHPGARAIAMTPICPHTLTNRSVIFSETVQLEVQAESEAVPELNVDGRQVEAHLHFPLNISVSKRNLKLLQPLDYSYFQILRTKLGWG